MNKIQLIEELAKRSIDCSEETADRLVAFMNHVLEWNEKFNLTAIKDEETFMEKMIFDSAIALTDLNLSNKTVLDVGTGAGFPGVVLYLLNPEAKITLLDSTAKKINLLKDYSS